MASILIAEDETEVALSLQKWLVLERHLVDLAADGEQAWEMLGAFDYDVLILDWEMPRLSGLELLRRVRQQGRMMPVLMLTGKSQLNEKEMALDEGADDYLTKPFHPRELSARLRALLRRPAQVITNQLQVRDIAINPHLRKVTKNGVTVALQPLEFDLLEFFARHPNQVFSSEALMHRVWGTEADVSLDAIYSCVKRLRKKLGTPGEPTLIQNVFGSGYSMEV